MTTPLDKEIKRELVLDDRAYTVTISPAGVKIVEKGKRLGREMTWRDLLSGDAELTSQLLRSVSPAENEKPAKGKDK
jgi:hypothetical protein